MPGNVFQKSDVFIMHSDLCKKIILTAHKNDEMIQLQRVCTPSSCLPMIAYLTSALKNVKELEEFFHSVAVQANRLFTRYICIIKVSSTVLNVHSRVQILRRAKTTVSTTSVEGSGYSIVLEIWPVCLNN